MTSRQAEETTGERPRDATRPAADLPRAISDPRPDKLPDQQLAGSSARRGRPKPAELFRLLGDARGASLGRRLVDHGRRPGRPGRPVDRRTTRARSSFSPT